MRDHLFYRRRIGSWILGAAAGVTIPLAPLSQISAQESAASAVPRTADGRPDLQGVYDVATITPLQRPGGVESLVLTAEAALAQEAGVEELVARYSEPTDPNEGAPPVGGDRTIPRSYLEILYRAGGGSVGGYNVFWLASGDQLITINGEKRSSIIVDPPNGRIPPASQSAQSREAAFLANRVRPDAAETGGNEPPGATDGPEGRPLSERCILGFGSTAGPPTLPNYFYNNLKQIVQTPDAIMILNEMIHDARVVRMNAEHLPDNIRLWMGDSVGHWEGDTLVVDTTNFTDQTRFQGSGPNLHVIERFSRLDENTLLYRFTVEDPDTWDRPWTGEFPWRATDEQIYEYACHEGNYSLAGVLGGARAAELEAAAQ